MGFWNMVEDCDSCQCPMCHQHIEPEKPTFNNCEWCYEGIYRREGGHVIIHQSQQWRVAGNRFEYYDHSVRMLQWTRLMVVTRLAGQTSPYGEDCPVCVSRVIGPHQVAYCGHIFHPLCYGGLLSARSSRCPRCMHGLYQEPLPSVNGH